MEQAAAQNCNVFRTARRDGKVMAKELHEMTHEERIEYYEKEREKEAAVRSALLFSIENKYPSMLEAVSNLVDASKDIGEDLQFYGAETVTVNQMHKLIDSAVTVTNLFHLNKEE
jgi:hypothetical protein